MQSKYKINAKVQWKWLGKSIEGVVEEIHFSSVVKTIKGKKITRHGSVEKPAYLVRSISGNLALKLETELENFKAPKKSNKLPKMFSS